LGIAQEYERSGEFTPKAKLRRSIIENLIFYGSFIPIVILYIVYDYYYQNDFSASHFRNILVGLANSVGLFYIIMLLGYGLIKIPLKLFS